MIDGGTRYADTGLADIPPIPQCMRAPEAPVFSSNARGNSNHRPSETGYLASNSNKILSARLGN